MKATDQRCLICGEAARISLGIRARYSNTNAVWAPNLDAYLCERHATSGCTIEIAIRATGDSRVRVTTSSPDRSVQTVLLIGSGIKEIPGQERLA